MKVNLNEIDLNIEDDFEKNIGNLSNNEVIRLIKIIERNIINKKYVNENVLFRLIKIIQDRLECAQTFPEYRKLTISIEKLLWLIKKNIDCEYNNKEQQQYDNIVKLEPKMKNSIIRLLDLENEREEKLTSFFKIRDFYI